jgi:hypothetical protein
MIRHKQFTTGTGRSGAAKYFTEHLNVSDYYANGVGLLQGRAFEHVGMQFREVDLAVFSALEQNVNPETGEKLTLRTNKTRKEWWFSPETGKREIREVDDRRSGMDLPMIVPKTVSTCGPRTVKRNLAGPSISNLFRPRIGPWRLPKVWP